MTINEGIILVVGVGVGLARGQLAHQALELAVATVAPKCKSQLDDHFSLFKP